MGGFGFGIFLLLDWLRWSLARTSTLLEPREHTLAAIGNQFCKLFCCLVRLLNAGGLFTNKFGEIRNTALRCRNSQTRVLGKGFDLLRVDEIRIRVTANLSWRACFSISG